MSRNLIRIPTLAEFDPVFDTGQAVPSNAVGDDSETEGTSPEGEMRSGGTGKPTLRRGTRAFVPLLTGGYGFSVWSLAVRKNRPLSNYTIGRGAKSTSPYDCQEGHAE